MATSLGKVGIVDRGNYSSEVTYNSGDFVFYEGSTWLALKDGLTGIKPVDGENWKYLARGVPENIQDEIDSIKNNKLDKTEFDNLQIGGRNLALGTSNKYTDVKYYPDLKNANASLGKVLNDGFNIGDTMMIRAIIKYTDIVPTDGKEATFKISGTGNITNWDSGYLEGTQLYKIEGSGEIEVLHKITIKDVHLKNSYWDLRFMYNYISSGSIQTKGIKAENSTKPSSWTPALEDITPDNIGAINVNKITDRLDVTEDGFVLGGKAGKALQDQIKTKLDKIDFDKLTIGGRNLLPNTLTLEGYRKPSTSTESTYKGFTVYENTFTEAPGSYHDLGLNNFIEPEPNTEYIYSFWAKGEGTIASYFFSDTVAKAEHCDGTVSTLGDGRIYTTLSPEWKRYWIKWTTRSDVSGTKNIVLCRQEKGDSKISLYGAKLERGTKPTDWTPAPEDLENPVFDDSGTAEGINSFTDFMNSVKSKMNIFQFYRDFKAGMKYVLHTGRLVNNAVTTEEGFALDARMGKTLQDQITEQNKNINSIIEVVRVDILNYIKTNFISMKSRTIRGFECSNAPVEGGNDFIYYIDTINDINFTSVIAIDVRTNCVYRNNMIGGNWIGWDKFILNNDIQWNWASGSELYTKVDTIVFDSYTYAKYCRVLNLCFLNQDWYIKKGTRIGYEQIKIANINEKCRPINDLYCTTTIEGTRVYINIKASNGDVLVSGNKEFILSENHCIRENVIYNLI